MPSAPPRRNKPGRHLAHLMEQAKPEQRHTILDYLERKYLAEGDLSLLREVRAYRSLTAHSLIRPR